MGGEKTALSSACQVEAFSWPPLGSEKSHLEYETGRSQAPQGLLLRPNWVQAMRSWRSPRPRGDGLHTDPPHQAAPGWTPVATGEDGPGRLASLADVGFSVGRNCNFLKSLLLSRFFSRKKQVLSVLTGVPLLASSPLSVGCVVLEEAPTQLSWSSALFPFQRLLVFVLCRMCKGFSCV